MKSRSQVRDLQPPVFPGICRDECAIPARLRSSNCRNTSRKAKRRRFENWELFARGVGIPYEEQEVRWRGVHVRATCEYIWDFAGCNKSLRRVTRLYRRSFAAGVPTSDRQNVKTKRS